MGCSSSKPPVLGESSSDGTDAEYKSRFDEGKELGQGEFGVVKLVTDKSTGVTYASKCLRKGFVFKDNTLYPPQPPEEIKRECDILRVLGGNHYNMKLEALYETPAAIYVVTELLSGGEMLDYVSETYEEGLRTEDASRMAYQMLDAVKHCASNGIIHRDLKPENIMFKTKDAGADLKLIDFGCAARDDLSAGGDAPVHKTFVGTPFYLAPEVLQQKNGYNNKADVFSIGTIMYVLVAGYPADVLQKAFNLLQKSKRDLRTLPNMPTNMPDTYFDLLDKLLTYRPNNRPSASDVLGSHDEFVEFHLELAGKLSDKKKSSRRGMGKKTNSVVFNETAVRHKLQKSYRQFQRSVTTILATVPSNDELQELVKKLKDLSEKKAMTAVEEGVEMTEQAVSDGGEDGGGDGNKLKVVTMGELKKLMDQMGLKEASETVSKLPKSTDYDSFAYDMDALEEFAKRRAKSAEYAAGNANGNAAANANGAAAAAKPTLQDIKAGTGAGAGAGGGSMRGGMGGGGLMKGLSFRPGSGAGDSRGGGMGRRSHSVFIR